MEDDEIRALVIRLSRRHASGGAVIERAAILAEGGDLDAIVAWIMAHDGRPEEKAAPVAGRGLHAPRLAEPPGGATGAPLRYVLPAGALA